MIKQALFSLTFFIFFNAFTQESSNYNIDFKGLANSSSCKKCMDSIYNLPEDVEIILQREGNFIYFGITDKRWFNHIFNSNKIGISVDVVAKKDFSCQDSSTLKRDVKGALSKPIYKKDILKNNVSPNKNIIYTPVFMLPLSLQNNNELEINLLILNKTELCRYIVFWSHQGNKFDILDMDLYSDSLSLSNSELDSTINHSHELTFKKTLFFTIPFEKDKFTYEPKDMKYIIDSISITDYNIKKIYIKGFSSVEGTTEHNLDLQEKRAHSIAQAIQSFQSNTFETNISSSENWNAFKKDISRSKYKYLTQKSKEEIKIELQNKELSEALEPMLSSHRKGLLKIELEKKINYDSTSSTIILKDLDQAFKDKNTAKALELIDIIYSNVESKLYSPEIIQDLNIPKSIEYGEQLLKKEVLITQNSNIPIPELYSKFLELESFLPKSQLLKYNLRTLEIKLFAIDESYIDRSTLAKNLQDLSKYKQIDPRLIKRLFINYHILLGEYYTEELEYNLKNISLSYIYNNFKKIKMNDTDLLRLSNYFVMYKKKQWALDVIKTRIKDDKASEDLLFQFINLTILDLKMIESKGYTELLKRASKKNNERFCHLYDCTNQGGISFQLLDFPTLKNAYCEECNH